MAFTTCSMLLALTISGPVTGATPRATATPFTDTVVVTAGAPAIPPATLRKAVLTTAVPEDRVPEDRVPDAWTLDRRETRPALLPALYASLAALQVYDVYSTRRALGAGAHEGNPLMRKAGNSGAMLAVKALSTAGTIYFTERAWKKNRKGALIMMAALNGATAMIAARNLRNAK